MDSSRAKQNVRRRRVRKGSLRPQAAQHVARSNSHSITFLDRIDECVNRPSTRLPTEADRIPEHESDDRARGDQRYQAGREIRIHHEQQLGGHLRPSVLFLPYTNGTNPMPHGHERQEQPRRVERQPVELGRRHRKSSIEIVMLPVLPSSDDPDLRTDRSARSTAVSLLQRPLSRHRSVLEHPATSVQQQFCVNLQVLTKCVNSHGEKAALTRRRFFGCSSVIRVLVKTETDLPDVIVLRRRRATHVIDGVSTPAPASGGRWCMDFAWDRLCRSASRLKAGCCRAENHGCASPLAHAEGALTGTVRTHEHRARTIRS